MDENRNVPLRTDGSSAGGTGSEVQSRVAQEQNNNNNVEATHPYKSLYDEDLIENAPTCYVS